MRRLALLTLAGALALSACGKKPEAENATNNLVEPPVENVVVDEPDAAPPPENNTAEARPALPPSVSEQQQMQDDADAVGMTARLPAGGEESHGSDKVQNGM